MLARTDLGRLGGGPAGLWGGPPDFFLYATPVAESQGLESQSASAHARYTSPGLSTPGRSTRRAATRRPFAGIGGRGWNFVVRRISAPRCFPRDVSACRHVPGEASRWGAPPVPTLRGRESNSGQGGPPTRAPPSAGIAPDRDRSSGRTVPKFLRRVRRSSLVEANGFCGGVGVALPTETRGPPPHKPPS